MTAFKLARILVPICLVFQINSSLATTVPHKNAHQLANEADLIFEGTVSNIEYDVEYRPTGNEDVSEIPITLVTYKIKEIIKGKTENPDEIALRFIGGPASDGRILTLDSSPLFDVGDNDIMFVKDNGTAWCPLVGWNQGRIRVIDDKVFSDMGQEVIQQDSGLIGLGAKRELSDVINNHVGQSNLKMISKKPQNETRSKTKALQGKHLNKTSYMKHIARLMNKSSKSSFKVVADAHSMVKSSKRMAEPAKPLKTNDASTKSQSLKKTADDLIEEELVRKNNGNPVL